MNPELKKILARDYSLVFDKKSKNAMLMSHYKYGWVKDNYSTGIVNAIHELKKRLKEYEETGNTEKLVDAKNFAMCEFMYPQHPNAHYKGTDSDQSSGLDRNEVEE